MDAAKQQVNGVTAGHCPTCRRYVGPASICPYCESPTDKPLRFVVLKIAALLLALGGLVLLYVMALHQDVALLAVEEMDPAMTFTYARIIGRVTTAPLVSRKYGRIHRVTLTIDDGTGTISIAAYEKRARALVNAGLPREGDLVEVEGSLSIRRGRQPRIYVDSPRQIRAAPARADSQGDTPCTKH